MPPLRCPACAGFLSLLLVEPHPVRRRADIHSFECEACRGLTSTVVELGAEVPPVALRGI